ncbi:hypothetical protein GW17_00005448 [Ensete ventricosum]|nr:hypothetical protein GW17_00005448 [Ensete ventricosum]
MNPVGYPRVTDGAGNRRCRLDPSPARETFSLSCEKEMPAGDSSPADDESRERSEGNEWCGELVKYCPVAGSTRADHWQTGTYRPVQGHTAR